ncbi:unnamed protein product [Musa acuminata subsp. burmannicoides]
MESRSFQCHSSLPTRSSPPNLLLDEVSERLRFYRLKVGIIKNREEKLEGLMRDTSERNEGVQKILPGVGRVCVSVCSGRIDVRPCELQLLALSSHSSSSLSAIICSKYCH